LDVMLPRLSGFEVCRRLRADPGLTKLRILMLTARGGEAEVARGADLGADAYVTKPFSTRELMDRIRALLAEAR
ncbi:MAG TPA: response regulator, partial [Anaeromyxobacteraceae bacterium]|nr:response regulator [Anaeromyxobacteraceae bacterium]